MGSFSTRGPTQTIAILCNRSQDERSRRVSQSDSCVNKPKMKVGIGEAK